MFKRYRGKHVNRVRSAINDAKNALSTSSRVFLSFALVCLLFPAAALAATDAPDGEDAGELGLVEEKTAASSTSEATGASESSAENVEGKEKAASTDLLIMSQAETESLEESNASDSVDPDEPTNPSDPTVTPSSSPEVTFVDADGAPLSTDEVYVKEPIIVQAIVSGVVAGDIVEVIYNDASVDTSAADGQIIATINDYKGGDIYVVVKGSDDVEKASKTFNKTVIVDAEDPVIKSVKITNAKPVDADETEDVAYFDLQEDMVIEAAAEDNSGQSSVEITAEFYNADGTSGSRILASETGKATLKISPDDFLGEDGSILKAKILVTAFDKAGNATGPSSLIEDSEGNQLSNEYICAENALLNDISDVIEIEKLEGTEQARNDSPDLLRYNGPVEVVKKDNLTLPAGSTFEFLSEGAKGKIEEPGEHIAVAQVKTKHGATKKYTKKFSIEKTTCIISISPSTDVKDTFGRTVLNGSDEVVVEVKATAVSNADTITVRANEAEIKGLDWTESTQESNAYTVKIPSSEISENDEVTIKVSVEDDFGVLTEDESETLFHDTVQPAVSYAYVPAFGKYDSPIALPGLSDEENLKHNVDFPLMWKEGLLIITVSDCTLKTSDLAVYHNDEEAPMGISSDKWEISEDTNAGIVTAKLELSYNDKPGLVEGELESYRVKAVDLAGNEIAENYQRSGEFCTDISAPSIVSVSSSVDVVTSTEIENVDLFDNSPEIKVRIADWHFDSSKSRVVVKQNGKELSSSISSSTWVETGETDSEKGAIYETSVIVPEGNGYTVEAELADLAGNAASSSYEDMARKSGGALSGDSISVDLTEPSVESVKISQSPVVVAADNSGADLFDKEVTVTVAVADWNFDKSSALVPEQNGSAANPAIGVSSWADAGTLFDGTPVYEASFTVPEGNGYTFRAKLADLAGNAASLSYGDMARKSGGALSGDSISVDTQAPNVSVSIDQPLVGSKKDVDYYASADENDVLTATITVTDRNLNESDTKIYAFIDKVKTEIKLTKTSETDDDIAIYEATCLFPETAVDKFHSVEVVAVDKVGAAAAAGSDLAKAHKNDYSYGNNNSKAEADGGAQATTDADGNKVNGKSFVLDLTAPDVSVSVDQPLAGTGPDGTDYYASASGKDKLTATIWVVDRSLDEDKTTVTAIIDGVDNLVRLNRVSDEGGAAVYVGTVEFPETAVDKLHSVEVVAVDKVGAVAAAGSDLAKAHKNDYSYGNNNGKAEADGGAQATTDSAGSKASGASFVLDLTAPNVSVSVDQPLAGTGPDGTDYYASADKNDVLTATVTVTDRNFDADSTVITPSGKGAVQAVGGSTWTQNGETWTAKVAYNENELGSPSDLEVIAVDKVATAAAASGNSAVAAAHENDYSYGDSKEASKAAPYGGARATTDADGSKASGASFVLDLTAPNVSVSIDQAKQNAHADTDYYGTCNSNNELIATITVTDRNFDADSTVITPSGKGAVQVIGGNTWTQNGETWTAKVAYKENDRGIASTLKIVAVDKVSTAAAASGNSAVAAAHENDYSYGDSKEASKAAPYGGARATMDSAGNKVDSKSFILDLTAPTLEDVQMSIKHANAYQNGNTGVQDGTSYSEPYAFYNQDTFASMSLKDNNGLANATVNKPFSFNGQDTVSDKGLNFTTKISLLEGTSVSDRQELDRNIVVALTDYANNSRTWSIAPDGTVKEVHRNNSGNGVSNALVDVLEKLAHPMTLVLDKTAPKLSWNTSVTPGSYYNTTQSIGMTVEELNFNYLKLYDSSQSVIQVSQYAGAAGRALTQWAPITVGNFNGSGSSYSTSMDFVNDGHYTLAATLVDPATNTTTLSFDEFTIDRTAPVIDSIVWDNNDVRNGKYYKAARTATITVTEHNWDEANSVITSNGSISGWSTNGDVHTATVSFTADGDYNLSVSVVDKAGNTAEQTEDEFTIDLTAPTITFSEVEEGFAYNDTIAPVITFADEKNFDSNGVAWTLTGNKNGTKIFDSSRAGNGNGETVSYVDFTREVESDDIYTLTATLVDLAGNEAEESIVFSVNRFGSNFIVVDKDKYAEHNGYMAEAPEVIIQEINVCGSESEEHGVSVTHGLKTENLERVSSADSQTAGYYIQAGEDSYGWASYYYHVSGANFTEDGNYHVVVNSTDRATNLNSSASYYEPETHEVANAEVTFILDTADPIIDGENIESRKTYSADIYEVTFTVTDNIGIEEVEVTLDGVSQKVTPEASGLCKVSVPAKSFTDRDMEITAVDLAGRSADKVVIEKFHVTTNFFELYWMWLVGAAVLVAACLIWFFLFKRKKNNKEEEASAK